MIRYEFFQDGTPINEDTLTKRVATDEATHIDLKIRKALKIWLKNAHDRTAQLLDHKSYVDSKKWMKMPLSERAKITKPIAVEWSSVKHIFMEIQHSKCAYCERKLADIGGGGAVEHDLEHYRPKNPVKAWVNSKFQGVKASPGHEGYYWLAFNLLNYCTSCKKCNSGCKINYFPIAGACISPPTIPSSIAQISEKPYLIYPLGTIDEDPEDIIRFRGVNAFPPDKDTILPFADRNNDQRNIRSQIIIDFFQLNNREELLWGRAEKLRELEKALVMLDARTSKDRRAAESDIRRLTSGMSEHTACIRGMIRIYRQDFDKARKIFDLIRRYLDSKTPKNYVAQGGKFKPKNRKPQGS